MLSAFPDIPIYALHRALHVVVKLLLRLSNDLRGTQILAMRGYPIQAASLVASMYEVAYTVAFIGDDEDLAQAWLDHDDPTTTFRNLWEMTHVVVAGLGILNPEARAKDSYRVYRQLCLAKHANPVLEGRFGVEMQGGVMVSSNGPDTSEEAIRIIWFTLQHAVSLSLVAMVSFWSCHLRRHCPSDILMPLGNALEAVGARRDELQARAVRRWGNEENPFVGRW